MKPVFTTKIKMIDTPSERFIGNALAGVKLFARFVQVDYDCLKEHLTTNEITNIDEWKEVEFIENVSIRKASIQCVSLKFMKDLQVWKLYVSGLEDFYFNFFFVDAIRANKFKNLILEWLFGNPTDELLADFKPDVS